jgi:predicted nucleic acid-binding protein
MIIFLDTNVMLDYINSRDKKTIYLLNALKQAERVTLTTSIFNMLELLDKHQELRHLSNLFIKQKYSFDEVLRNRREKQLSNEDRDELTGDINDFMNEFSIEVYKPVSESSYETILRILTEIPISSQDAMILGTYADSAAQMFLTKDGALLKEGQRIVKGTYNATNTKEVLKDVGVQK